MNQEVPRQPQEMTASAFRVWVNQLCALLDVTPTRLAIESGIAHSSITRRLKPDFAGGPTLETVRLIQEGAGRIARRKAISLPDDSFLDGARAKDLPEDTILVRVMSKLEPGVWREDVEASTGGQVPFKAPSIYSGARLAAFEIVGAQMDLIYPAGCILIAVDIRDYGRLKFGKNVIVERRNPSGLVELTAKEYALGRNGKPELVSRTSRPGLNINFPLDSEGKARGVRITHVVISSQRYEF
jgi:hypothetical protein